MLGIFFGISNFIQLFNVHEWIKSMQMFCFCRKLVEVLIFILSLQSAQKCPESRSIVVYAFATPCLRVQKGFGWMFWTNKRKQTYYSLITTVPSFCFPVTSTFYFPQVPHFRGLKGEWLKFTFPSILR